MGSRFDELRIFSGNGNPALTQAICDRIGVRPGDATVTQFVNENIFVRLNETVREKDVFVVQSLSSPLNDRIMELLIMLDACKRASAGRITAVIPYYAYGRTDKRDQPRVPITARLFADMIEIAGANQVITMDLHAGQIQGFFNIPVDELSGLSLLSRYYAEKNLDEMIVVSPDMGFAKRARNLAERLGVPLVIAEKRRIQQFPPAANGSSKTTTTSEVLNLIGDVAGKRCILVDDEIATGGSIVQVAHLLMEQGAREVYAGCVHPVLVGPAVERLAASPIVELVVTDSLPVPPEKQFDRLKVLSVSTMLAEVIQRIHSGISVDTMFQHRDHPALL
ncbi:MAG: ribose-phosphate pyrophosphokinase [Chloroflexaceae bacterium]|nr:ribose-phosphate pyrophosphokinase [Chloroflexaceae bacterium]